jgi:Flp pilus assembly protein TadG
LVEFALVLPLLLLLVMLVTEFGRAVYLYNGAVKQVRDAARYLSLQTPNDAAAISAARNLIVYGNTDGTGQQLDANLGTSQVATPTWTTTGSAPILNIVTVRVTGYTFTPIMGSLLGLTIGTLTFSDITATMRSPS